MNKCTCISVIMSVYNAEKYVRDCIRSILKQTFSDFEFIIINDASTDRSPEIIRSFKDRRIRLLNNKERSYPTRNKGLRIARGKYICIMDADDISLPHRFERQVLFMEQNPQYGLAGSGYRVLGKERDLYRESDYQKIKVQLMRNNCFIHPSVIIRHDLLKRHKLRYIKKYYYSSDYDFLARAARYFPVTNIPEVLMHYRVHEGQVTIQYRKRQAELADEIAIDQLRFIGINPTKEETGIHLNLLKGIPVEYSQKQKLYKWLDQIREANGKAGFYDKNELEAFFEALMLMQPFCKNNLGMPAVKLKTETIVREDLTDVTFIIPVRITSDQVIENLNTTIGFLKKHFNTNFYVLEADTEQRYFPVKNQMGVRYDFIRDDNPIFHRTKWINRMLNSVDTPYVAVWEPGVICSAYQITDAVNKLRSGSVVLSYPYDGTSYNCDFMTSELFKMRHEIERLLIRMPVMHLKNGYHSVENTFIIDRVRYLQYGGENEKILEPHVESNERKIRIEGLQGNHLNSKGSLFYLYSPTKRSDISIISDNTINSMKEMIKTCSK